MELYPSPLPVSSSALDALYDLSSQLTLKVCNLQHDVSKLLTFAGRHTVGEAADEAARELGCFMTSPTFMDPCGHVHRRDAGLVSMINGETVQLINLG